ncbi:kinase-like domain-containing protein [Gongronella butleri]|nr:kinase-like domain-containing protein [Gongronella butleri]
MYTFYTPNHDPSFCTDSKKNKNMTSNNSTISPRPVPLHIDTHSLGIRLTSPPNDATDVIGALPPAPSDASMAGPSHQHPHHHQYHHHHHTPHPTPPPSVATSPNQGAPTFMSMNAVQSPSMSTSSFSSSSSASSSSSPSPSSSATSTPAQTYQVTRRKSILNRKSGSNVTSPVTCQSWDHLASPAASFLASFASPGASLGGINASAPLLEEQTGDEIDDYVMNEIIGYGGSSTVRKGYSISHGQHVAIKIVKRSHQDALERELAVWAPLSHPNILRLHKVLETDNATYVVSDYCPETLLRRLQRDVHGIPQETKKRWFGQLLSAVHYLHDQCHVVHKDIKLDNILLDQDDNIKLCDFGLAMHRHHMTPPHLQVNNNDPGLCSLKDDKDMAHQPIPGSLCYCSPEQLAARQELTCPKTDVWAIGVVLYAMFAGRLPFDDEYDLRLRQAILDANYTIPDAFSNDVADLVRHCLVKDPANRFSMQQIFAHPWLA